MQDTLATLGEQGLLKRLAPYFGHSGQIQVPAGDDGAVLAMATGNLVITTDLLFEGVHFSERTTRAADVGWRAAAANLSDLAAMGARPIGTLIGLGLPPETPVNWVEELYRGFTECADPHGAPILGGDTCRAQSRSIAVTALGIVAPDRVLKRTSAQPTDVLVVTGTLGDSQAGLEVLLDPVRYCESTESDRARVIEAHRRPRARLEVPELVWQVSSRAAAMDTSDGLADAVLQVSGQSGCGAVVYTDRLPISLPVRRIAGARAEDWALYGGEDFELLLAVPASVAGALLEVLNAAGVKGTAVGQLTPGAGAFDQHGLPLRPPTFEHFTGQKNPSPAS